jgi:organic hydroperoxide reductase OsmC/OhrA
VSEHRASVTWERKTPGFAYETYDRTHEVRLAGGQALRGSAAPEFKGDAACANPEELLCAALAGCHMLTFLAIAAKSRLVVDAYRDEAVATLAKNAEGRMAVTAVTLRPRVRFGGQAPSPERLRELHEKAHQNCFVAASVRCAVALEPSLEG